MDQPASQRGGPGSHPGQSMRDLWSTKGKWGSFFSELPYFTLMEAQGETKYSSCSFLTSALDGVAWPVSRPGRALPLEKGSPIPIVQEAE
jgi:hypothetical protein